MSTPKSVLEAITHTSGTPVDGWTVSEITLGMAGVLEAIESPLLRGKKLTKPKDWAMTLFAMTHSTEECEALLANGIEEYARAVTRWSDTVTMATTHKMIKAAVAAAERLAAAIDVGDDDDEGKEGNASAATAG